MLLLLLSHFSRVRLCDPIGSSPPGSPVPGILQARALEWVAISFSNAWKWKVKVKSLSCVRLLATPWTAAYQTPPFMGFSRQEYWSGVPLPSPKKKARVAIFISAEQTSDLSQVFKTNSTFENSCNLSHQQGKEEKSCNPINICRKSTWWNLPPI